MGGVGYRTYFDAAVGFVNGAGLGDGAGVVQAGGFDDEDGADDCFVIDVGAVIGGFGCAGNGLTAVPGSVGGYEFAGLGKLADPDTPMLDVGFHGVIGQFGGVGIVTDDKKILVGAVGGPDCQRVGGQGGDG